MKAEFLDADLRRCAGNRLLSHSKAAQRDK
jgi:hypothetical protein